MIFFVIYENFVRGFDLVMPAICYRFVDRNSRIGGRNNESNRTTVRLITSWLLAETRSCK